MNIEDLKGLRYYMICCALFLSFYIYSGITGWKWFNPTKTEATRPVGGRPGHIYSHHK